MYPMSYNAISYTLEHLFKVAGFLEFNASFIDYSSYPVNVKYNYFGIQINFKLYSNQQISQLLSGSLILKNIKTADSLFSIPIMLENELPFSSVKGNQFTVNADIISISFIMLSRFEEILSDEHDIFGNYLLSESIAMKYNFIDFPIVDEYAKLLQLNFKIIFSNHTFNYKKCRIIPTHDIDEIFRYSFSIIGFRRIITDLLFSMKSFKFKTIFKMIILRFIHPEKDPFFDSINTLLKFSIENNLTSEFYFMAAKKNKYNIGYDISNKYIVKLLKNIQKNKMIIGLHGGYGTRNNVHILTSQKRNLDIYLDNPTIYGRQHYLHFDIHKTFQTIESSGITFDSTLGYNSREGFRCGTSHSYNAWNFQNDTTYNLVVRPLIVMDITFWLYKKQSINEAYAKIIFLFKRCKYVGGDFIINWHNVYVLNKEDWFFNVYCNSMYYIINDLKKNDY